MLKLSSVMARLNDFVEQELRQQDPDVKLVKVVFPGDTVVDDYVEMDDCNTVVWSRLTGSNPTTRFPTPDNDPSSCFNSQAYVIDFGIQRSAPGVETFAKDIEAPDPDSLFQSADRQYEDITVMRNAALRLKKSQGVELVLLGGYTPAGPAGGIFSGTTTVTVGLE